MRDTILILLWFLLLAWLFFATGCSVRCDGEGPLQGLCARAVMAISNATPCAERHEARRVEQRVETECFDSWNLSTWEWRNGERVRVPVKICVPRKRVIVDRDCGP